MKSFRKYVYIGLPILGTLFYLYYLHIATIDMIYSDYIRLINSYLPDVWNPEKFFVADLLTRMPISYLGRAINVTFFDYSVTFDRLLGVLSFGASAWIIGGYCKKHQTGLGWYAAIMVFLFSLNKWEMLYNSTGWMHFLAFVCFFYHYTVLDRVYRNEGKPGDLLKMMVLPAITTIFIAGPYCAVYSMTLFIAYGFIWLQNTWLKKDTDDEGLTNKQIVMLAVNVLWPLLLYIWSNSQAVYEHAGAVEGSLIGTLFEQPKFFLKFLLKSFSSIIFGVELITERMQNVPELFLYVTGAGVLASYFLALWMNFYYGVYKKTIFPLMLLAGGGMNHLIVMVSRWIFLKDTYGMSSRYALQYQVGILGILLTFAFVWKMVREEKQEQSKAKRGFNTVVKLAALLIAAVVLGGNLMTTKSELAKAPYRKEHSLGVKEILLDFENQDDEVLKQKLEYSKPGKKEALRILRDNGWNIFKQED
ncbi:MAG: hypothetical protein E7246_09150 [Lachnoclostridium sp.]|nr:hypothetical protein [Lachnoclostridium sp.]